MIEAIVYKSQTGHTKQYAQIISRETGLPAYDLDRAIHGLVRGTPVLFMGWIMASSVTGLRAASVYFTIKGVVAVGMTSNESKTDEINKVNGFNGSYPVYFLAGGLEYSKLKGFHRFLIRMIKNSIGKQLQAKTSRTKEEEQVLSLLTDGGNLVDEKNLKQLITWVNKHKD